MATDLSVIVLLFTQLNMQCTAIEMNTPHALTSLYSRTV